ncbi:MAG: class I SAM-dependent methyltransferase [Desulfuromonadaceae bacterium]|nr:class I SAM-dependent methyltransferase [Desulfuromonadaceae bacterium]
MVTEKKMAYLCIADITSWSHRLCAEILDPGDLAIDLTAGNGNDTLHLAQCTAAQASGCVIGFDIQQLALNASATLLTAHDFPVCIHTEATANDVHPASRVCSDTGVHLFHCGHQHLKHHLPRAPKVIIGNLGYLPGASHTITTNVGTTLSAVEQGLAALVPQGRLLLVVYPGHPAGHEEAHALMQFFAKLPKQRWDSINIGCLNAAKAPFLLGAERRR